MTPSSSARPYGGIDAAQRVAERRERLLEAGLDLLGSADEGSALTVRGVCTRAGLVARYFYEGFADSDALAVAVYEQVVQDLVEDALAALTDAPADDREQIRFGLSAIIDHLADDPRRGRLMFTTAVTHPALAAKRLEMMRMFAGLLATQAQSFYDTDPSSRLDAVARFLVGGFGETLTAWQHGDLDLSQEDLVEVCLELFAASFTSLGA
ncbi:TetR/AcrR family transcriptional regulator [Aeromicrobium sp. A1-2]|uniref:TetR/AcrR family transcriptional regulator n=1 Tax=Aeromicrobium sp. A1-2 TaxID=2107713 RepID=UPI000E49549D|nr:TetR/AcrR family transcriptional regulator [Aeromicrobium sp. A1-2]AXT85447.1 TetR/AcrR family transcriptional regulator [Aeromicrobium sp. A1-2]